jgi:hypothetical protein
VSGFGHSRCGGALSVAALPTTALHVAAQGCAGAASGSAAVAGVFCGRSGNGPDPQAQHAYSRQTDRRSRPAGSGDLWVRPGTTSAALEVPHHTRPHLLGASLLNAPHCLVYLKVVVGRQHCHGLIQLRVVEDAVGHLLPHKAAHRGWCWCGGGSTAAAAAARDHCTAPRVVRMCMCTQLHRWKQPTAPASAPAPEKRAGSSMPSAVVQQCFCYGSG